MKLVTTAQEILSVLASRPDEGFYINELVRLTGRYPNSVEQALKTLSKNHLVGARKMGNKRFYQINPSKITEVASRLPRTNNFDWIKVLNREVGYAFHLTLCHSNTVLLPKVYGVPISRFWYNGVTFAMYYSPSEMASIGQAIAQKLQANRNFGHQDVVNCRRACDQAIKFSESLYREEFSKKDRGQLKQTLFRFVHLYENIFPYVMAPHAIERYFEKEIRRQVNPKTADVLLLPTITSDPERNNALKLAAQAKKGGFDKKFEDLLTAHWQNFTWLPLWDIKAAPLTKDYFRQEIENILEKIADPARELLQLETNDHERQQNLQKTLNKIKASRGLRDLVYLLQEYIFLRTYRKNAICQAHYYHLPLLHEIARRLKLTAEEIKFLSYDEIRKGLCQELSEKVLKKMAQDRQNGWGVLTWEGKTSTVTGAKRIVETLEQYRIVSPASISHKILHGSIACKGKVIGKVKVIHHLSELVKIQTGDILVTKMTTPDYMMAINKCVGIITDEGGITCHAAIVSREFSIPCLVATHQATKILHDNDVVELDANNGVVRVVEKTILDSSVKEIAGKPIHPGKIKGTAVVVLDAADFPKVTSGQILITSQTTPDFLSCLYRVKGLVVDEDSLTSHAVLYANALKIPTITSTQNAREIISDGESLTLNATKGIVSRK